MRRALFFGIIFSCLAGIAFAVIRHIPLWHSFIPEKKTELSPVPDSLRTPQYYKAILSTPVDSIFVVKHVRELYVFNKGKLLKIYRIALGDMPKGHKHFQGDEKTPEGLYFIDGKNPYSSCHKNLGISYPNNHDRLYAKRVGKPSGGDIKIHGLPNGQGHVGAAHILHDWTNGCMGVTDAEIDELFYYVRVGTPIFIAP